MELKIACADFSFPLLEHSKVLDLISMLGIEGVDIGLFQDRSHLQPSTEFVNVKQNANALRAKLQDRGLKPADVFLQTSLDFVSSASNHPDTKKREKARMSFLQTLEYACECGCKHVSALPGVYFEGESKEDSFRICCDELAWRVNRAKDAGVVFSVEAHVGSIAPTPQEAMSLVKTTPGLTLTLDYTHFTKQGFPDSEIEPLIQYASHFHARSAANGKLQTILQENTIDYTRVVKIMRETNYSGYIGIEYTWNEWENCNRTDNLSETILLRNFIRDVYTKAQLP